MHYNDGWGSPPPPARRFASRQIAHLEVWNEPDSAGSTGRFWNRTSGEFHELVGDAIVALKAYDPALSVGSDGCALVEWPSGTPAPWYHQNRTEYSWGLLSALAARGVPLDFFSWHAYTANIDLYARFARDVRARLDAAGFAATVQHVTEWAPAIDVTSATPLQDTALGAASVGATLATFVEANVSVAVYYPACSMGNKATGNRGWGVWDAQSVPGMVLKRPLTYVLEWFGGLVRDTPARLPATVQVPATATPQTFTALAGRSRNGSVICALVSSQRGNFTAVELDVGPLPGKTWRFSVTGVAAAAPVPLGAGPMPANGQIAFSLPPPAVALVRITQS